MKDRLRRMEEVASRGHLTELEKSKLVLKAYIDGRLQEIDAQQKNAHIVQSREERGKREAVQQELLNMRVVVNGL